MGTVAKYRVRTARFGRTRWGSTIDNLPSWGQPVTAAPVPIHAMVDNIPTSSTGLSPARPRLSAALSTIHTGYPPAPKTYPHDPHIGARLAHRARILGGVLPKRATPLWSEEDLDPLALRGAESEHPYHIRIALRTRTASLVIARSSSSSIRAPLPLGRDRHRHDGHIQMRRHRTNPCGASGVTVSHALIRDLEEGHDAAGACVRP